MIMTIIFIITTTISTITICQTLWCQWNGFRLSAFVNQEKRAWELLTSPGHRLSPELNGMDEMGWDGMEWNEMESNGMEQNGWMDTWCHDWSKKHDDWQNWISLWRENLQEKPRFTGVFSLVSFECFFELIYFSARPGILGFEGERWQSILQIVII